MTPPNNTTYLTIIQYDTSADQVFLVQNATHIYSYVENTSNEHNVMIAELTSSEKRILLSKGYTIQTIDENPEIENYLYFYNESAGQSNTLAQFGPVYSISPNHTLVQYDSAETFNLQAVPEFILLPLEDTRAIIAEKNNVDHDTDTNLLIDKKINADSTLPIQVIEPAKLPPRYLGSYIMIGGVVLAVLLVIVALVYYRHTRAMKN